MVLAQEDQKLLDAGVPERRQAARVGGTLHLRQLLTRLLAESGDPHSTSS